MRYTSSVSFFMKPRPFMLAAASGVLSALGVVFPPLFFFIWIAFVPLFLSLRAQPRGKRLVIGLITGIVYFGGAFYWVWSSTVHLFAFSALAASLLLLCFLLWHGFFFALFATALRQQPSVGSRLLFPALLWTALEHYYPMLIPWQFGVILQPHLEVIQLAEVTGGAGLSCLILFVNGLFFHAYEQRRRQKVWGLYLAAALGVILALDAHGRWRLSQIDVEPPAPTLLVTIVQGNAPPMREMSEESFWRSLQAYSRLSLTATRQSAPPALVVWPELSVRATLHTDEAARDVLFTVAEQGGAPLLVGALDRPRRGEMYNSAFLISSAGEIFGSYHKKRLLPFAESLPWPVSLFADWWPAPSFVAGTDAEPLLLPGARFAVSICYEALFPGFFRQPLLNGAEFLVNLTNDVWLGDTSGPGSHLQAAVMRAVESRRWLVRAANSGVSAVIAPSGRIVARTELFTVATLHEQITLRHEDTFYTRWGDWFVLVCLAGVCLMGVARLWSETSLRALV